MKKPTLLGLRKTRGQSEYFDWNSESESYFFWTYSQGRQTPHHHCLQFTPVFVGTWKTSGKYSKIRYTHLLILRGNIHVCWSLRPSPFLSFGRGKGWLARNPPSSDIEVSPFPRANVWAPYVTIRGTSFESLWERLHLRTSSVFRFACHVTFGHMCFKKNIVLSTAPEPTVAKNVQKEPLQLETLQNSFEKTPKNPWSLTCNNPNLPCLGRKCTHSMPTKYIIL